MEEFLVQFRNRDNQVQEEYITAPNEIAANNRAYTEFQASEVLSVVPAPQQQLFARVSMLKAIEKYDS